MECVSCRSLTGEARIAPAPPIHDGRGWIVEHAYPSGLEGWLVVEVKRHVEAAHELTPEDFAEMAALIEASVKVLSEAYDTEKEYVALFAEAPGFHHVHVHVIPVLPSEELRGASVFTYLKPVTSPLDPGRLVAVCKDLSRRFARTLDSRAPRPRHIFHISRDFHPEGGRYTPEALANDGFIHCSTASQVLRVADSLFLGHAGLSLVSIDADVLGESLVYEDCCESSEAFPHVYGPIPESAVISVVPLRFGPDGAFRFPNGIDLTDRLGR